ncbi:MAG TPA: type II toxin-antitoxin system VapC family toxin [Azospirillaceae bacterium]|nr:type II toxin-antitoxin system VapC family toxin [Azospirillaceae bacterium]
MRLLLDTHVYLWSMAGDQRLGAVASAAIRSPQNQVFVSAVTAWEIAIKRTLGKLDFPVDEFEVQTDAAGFRLIDITTAHGIAAGSLPRHHDDPFDRMLIAQAQLEGLTLVTADMRLPSYGIATLRP